MIPVDRSGQAPLDASCSTMHRAAMRKNVIPYSILDVQRFLQTGVANLQARDAKTREMKNAYFTGFFRVPATEARAPGGAPNWRLTLCPLRSSSVAFLVFATAAARAELIAPDFWLIAVNRLRRFFFVFVGVELLNATPRAGHRSEQLFDLVGR